MKQKKKSFPRRVFFCLLAVLLVTCIAFGVYVLPVNVVVPAQAN